MAASIPPVKFCCLHSYSGHRWRSQSWHCDRTTVFHHSYLWKIEKFDTIKVDVYSPVIEPCNDFQIKWQITLQQSDRNEKGFLVRMLTPNRRSVGFKLTFNILKPDGQVDDSLGEVDNIPGKFNYKDSFVLLPITITQLRDPSRNLLTNGSLHLKCDFSVMVDVIDFSPWEDLCALQTDMHKPMATILQSGKFSDVTLIVKGEKLFAHKAILYPRSSVFAAMFEHETMAEYKTNQIIINDFEPAVIRELLTFIYTDTAPNIEVLVRELLAAADKYNVGKLKRLCESVLNNNISKETVLPTLVLADQRSARILKIRCIHYIKKNLSSIAFTNEWKIMFNNYPQLIQEIEAYKGCSENNVPTYYGDFLHFV
ncbi:speckle-type POZ protein-like [Musca autumnalis]|uniref:speckle-type POZ protein-like n=1 Tax=Musca autumnalis TaxID=221902 RepID=UPI003CEF2AC0